jgi:broad specificity phosphatase PhoE
VAVQIAQLRPDLVFVSPLRRARFLAGLTMRELGTAGVRIDPRLAECHFGRWEGLAWDRIYAETGDLMMGLIQEPATFRPGGDGETTFAMRDRAMAWLEDAVRSEAEAVAAICHGGPIAAIRGTLLGLPPCDWPGLVPDYGELVTIEKSRL